MKALPWRSLAVAASLVGALATAGVMSQQTATPPPGVTVPDPSECRVAPRTEAELRRVSSGTPGATPEPYRGMGLDALPTGEPADDTTVSEVEAIMREIVACGNAGDLNRARALLTDALVLQRGPIDLADPEEIRAATPHPYPEGERSWIVDVRDVLILDDGRIVAIVTVAGNTEDPHPAPGRTQLVYFARIDGRLLIDDVIDQVVPPGEGFVYVADAILTPVATPPAGVSIPEPGECRVEPRSDEDLARILTATSDATPSPFDRSRPEALPTGTPADGDTVARVEETVREFVACRNAGDPRRALALGTDAYAFNVRAMNPGMVGASLASTPVPLSMARQVWVEDVRDVMVLGDGQIVAIVTLGGNTRDSYPDRGEVSLMYFVRDGDRLLIDQTFEYIVTPVGEIVWVAEAVATPGSLATPAS